MSKNRKSRRHKGTSVHPTTAQKDTAEPVKDSSRSLSLTQRSISPRKKSSRLLVIALAAFLSIGVLGAGLNYLESAARMENARRQQNPLVKNESWMASMNPFLLAPTPTPTPQLSKEYIYAGSRMLAAEDAAANAIPPVDLAVWRPSNGNWYCLGGAAGSQGFTANWGTSGDVPTPGDYDDDGKTDLAIFRPSTGTWWIAKSSDGLYYTMYLGLTGAAGDLPAKADFDGDGKTDPAIFRPASQHWYIIYSSTGSLGNLQFGATSDKPAAADYDGDGKADEAVWRDSEATFYAYVSSLSQMQTQTLGSSGNNSSAVSGDYDGDGQIDYAIRSGDNWIIRQSSDGQTLTIGWHSGSFSVPNDYDGDGKCDIAVWRSTGKGAGNWYIRQSSQIGQSSELRQLAW